MFNKSKITEIETQLADTRARNRKLQQECNDLSLEKSQLTDNLTTTSENLDALRNTHSVVAEQNEKLLTKTSSQAETIEAQSESITMLKEELAELNKASAERIQELTSEVTRLKQLLGSKDLEIEKAKNKTLDRVIEELKSTA